IADILTKEYNVTPQQLAQLWNAPGSPLRSAQGQQILFDLARFKLAQADAREKISKPVPPVMRPGVAIAAAGNDREVDIAAKAFRQNPTAQNAADLVLARRANRR